MATKPRNPNAIRTKMREKFTQFKKRVDNTLFFNYTRNQLERYKKIVLKVADDNVGLDGVRVTKQADRLFGYVVDLFHGHLSEVEEEGKKSEAQKFRIAKQEQLVGEKEKKLAKRNDKVAQEESKLYKEKSVLEEMKTNSRATRHSMPLHEQWRQFKENVSVHVQRFKKFIKGTEVEFAPVLTDNEKKLLENAGNAVLETLDEEVRKNITEVEVKITALGEVETTAKYNDESGQEQRKKFAVKMSLDGTYIAKEKKSFADMVKSKQQSTGENPSVTLSS